jgi:hypothetical protein
MTAKITAFDAKTVDAARAAIKAALEKVEADLGVRIEVGRITYGEKSFKAEMTTMIETEELSNPALVGVDLKSIKQLQRYPNLRSAFLKQVSFKNLNMIVVGMRGTHTILVREIHKPSGAMLGLKQIDFYRFTDFLEVLRTAALEA